MELRFGSAGTVYNVYTKLELWRRIGPEDDVMAISVAAAVKVLSERAHEDPELADTLRYLAQRDAGPGDPFGTPAPTVRAAARRINRSRQADRLSTRRLDTLDTAGVVRLVASLQDRRGVDRRRRRGQLLGWTSGARTLHPIWQFDPARGETRPGLAAVIAALGQVTLDPQGADELMRAPREDLKGRNLADLFATGRVQTVVRMILASADQS
jgi:hypothetical protein